MTFVPPPPYIADKLSLERERGQFFWSTVKRRFDKNTQENVDLAVTMFRNGAPLNDISTAVKACRGSVRQWLIGAIHDEYKGRRESIREARYNMIVQLRAQGWTWKEVAQDAGFSTTHAAMKWARDYGIQAGGWKRRRTREPLSTPHKQTIAELVLSLRMEGKTWAEVGAVTGQKNPRLWAVDNGMDRTVFESHRPKKGKKRNERS